jgi:CheY-like chemotaxis protein
MNKKKSSFEPTDCHLLLVDDHTDTLLAAAKYLRRCGFTVHTASSFAEAVAVAQAQRVDVLITDLGLPDGDGCALFEEIRATAPVRGLAVTGYGMSDDVERCRRAGFERHLLKPVNPDELRHAIEGACEA